MLVQTLKTFDSLEILMLAASVMVIVGIAFIL